MKRFLLFCLCAVLACVPGSAQTIHTQTIAHRGEWRSEVYKEVTLEYGAAITAEPKPEGDYQTFEWVE